MSKFEKVFILILALTLCIPTITNAENAEIDIGSISEGKTVIKDLPEGITLEDFNEVEGIQLSLNEEGQLVITALKDMENVKLYYSIEEKEIEKDVDEGEGSISTPGTGEGSGVTNKNNYEFGKTGVDLGNRILFTIKFDTSKLNPDITKTTIIDKLTKGEGDLDFQYIAGRNFPDDPNEELGSSIIINNFDLVEDDDNLFKINIDTEELIRYDAIEVQYYVYTDVKVNNSYKVLQGDKEIVKDAWLKGENTEDPKSEEDAEPEDKEDEDKNPEDPNKSDPVKPEDDKEEPIIEEKDKPIIKEDQPNNVDKVKQTGLLPKTGEAFPTGTYTIGSSLIALGLYMLRKGRRM